jgi:peptidoglycan/LPS O-acetylase OafA/YrhL
MITGGMIKVTSREKKSRLPEIDGLRAVACLMVFLYHTHQFAGVPGLNRWMDPLATGVDLFIVLSGFCLFLPVVKDPSRFTARRFFTGRARRIVPAYYASMIYVVGLPFILVIFWRAIGKPATWQPIPSVDQWLTHLTFTHMFSTHTWDGINGSYWSLGLEAEFYVAMPVLVWLLRRYGVRGLLVPAAISVIWNVVTTIIFWGQGFSPLRFVWEANLPARWFEFTAGALAAYLVNQTRTGQLRLSPMIRNGLAGAGLALIVADLYLLIGSTAQCVGFIALPTGVFLFIIGVSAMPHKTPIPPARLLRFPPLRALGTISYSFYLLHQPTEWYLSQLLKGMGVDGLLLWVLELTIGTSIIVVLATGSWMLFEKSEATPSRIVRRTVATPA